MNSIYLAFVTREKRKVKFKLQTEAMEFICKFDRLTWSSLGLTIAFAREFFQYFQQKIGLVSLLSGHRSPFFLCLQFAGMIRSREWGCKDVCMN